jgi:hypothetical protein
MSRWTVVYEYALIMWLEINSASVKIRRLNVELFRNKTNRKTIVFTFQISYINITVLYNDTDFRRVAYDYN